MVQDVSSPFERVDEVDRNFFGCDGAATMTTGHHGSRRRRGSDCNGADNLDRRRQSRELVLLGSHAKRRARHFFLDAVGVRNKGDGVTEQGLFRLCLFRSPALVLVPHKKNLVVQTSNKKITASSIRTRTPRNGHAPAWRTERSSLATPSAIDPPEETPWRWMCCGGALARRAHVVQQQPAVAAGQMVDEFAAPPRDDDDDGPLCDALRDAVRGTLNATPPVVTNATWRRIVSATRALSAAARGRLERALISAACGDVAEPMLGLRADECARFRRLFVDNGRWMAAVSGEEEVDAPVDDGGSSSAARATAWSQHCLRRREAGAHLWSHLGPRLRARFPRIHWDDVAATPRAAWNDVCLKDLGHDERVALAHATRNVECMRKVHTLESIREFAAVTGGAADLDRV